YVAVATAAVLAFSGHDHAGWDLLLTAHALILILVLIAPAARQAGPVGRFLGDWYPMLLLGGLYAEVGVLNVDLAYQHDLAVQRLELWAFGSQLSYRWMREMPNPLLSWFLHGCYLAYYAILYASPLGLWLSGRRAAVDARARAVARVRPVSLRGGCGRGLDRRGRGARLPHHLLRHRRRRRAGGPRRAGARDRSGLILSSGGPPRARRPCRGPR